MSEWSVDKPGKHTFDAPVTSLHVRIVNGTVNVMGTDEGPARLEVTELQGPPLTVTHRHGVLTVAYEDLPWKGFLKWIERKGWRRSATVTLAVPSDADVEVGVVGAHAMISGISGRTDVKGVTGETTLLGLTGPVSASTVSGALEAQALAGDLRFNSVSGDLTVVEGTGPTVRADSVSGSMIVDLGRTDQPASILLTNVSGEIALRLPEPGDAEVRADTAGGTISNAFEDLKVSGPWGAHRLTGRLGKGRGRVRATTVSGSIALLRRPPAEDEPWDEGPWDDKPWDDKPPCGGPRSDTPRHEGPTSDAPTSDGPRSAAPGSDGPPTDTEQPPGADGAPEATDAIPDPPDRPASSGDNDGTGQASSADGTTDKKVL